MTLVLFSSIRSELASWARVGYPRETCGLLIGRVRGDETAVERAVIARNTNDERAHDRYELDPQDHLNAQLSARNAGQEIVGIWHSHPDHAAVPSETDRLAAWDGWSYLIVEVRRDGAGAFRAWRLECERFVEENVKRAESSPCSESSESSGSSTSREPPSTRLAKNVSASIVPGIAGGSTR